jgi:hypothetical protein
MLMKLKLARPRHTGLVTCSLCLSVRRGSAWIEAEAVIRERRSYELPAAPRLRPAVCDNCAAAIFDLRANAEEAIAA